MSKKTMFLALVVSGVALFALPSIAAAAEIHFEGANEFVGHGFANTPTVKSEPAITCETADVQGVFSSGGTTGIAEGELTGCHVTVFGFTAKCRTTGSALDNTIKSGGAFHLITYVNGTTSVPAMLGTLETTTVVCAGISNIEVAGSVISTITKPACGESTKVAVGKASATNGVQNQKTYTGKQYYPTARTSGGEALETGLDAEGTIEFPNEVKLVCT